MPDDTTKQQPDNAYPLDVESGSEMARLLDQDRLITEAMGGILPERDKIEIIPMHDILDIACGPGGWVHDVAFAYPHITVTGIDISHSMIEYAQAFARVRHLDNARFRVMNALKPLDFPAESFDLVNMRSLAAATPSAQWPQLLQECRHILRPGGTIRITDLEWGFTNMTAFEKLARLSNEAIAKAGLSFSPTGYHLGLTPVMKYLLRKAGFVEILHQAHALDFSYGTKAHDSTCRDYQVVLKLGQAFVAKSTNTPIEVYEELYEQAMVEMQSEDFCGLLYIMTAWGEKPA